MKKLIDKHFNVITKNKSDVETLKKSVDLTTEVAIKFGRYLLKEANHHWDKDATLCWKVANEEFDTQFLFEKFINEVLE